MEHGTVMNRPIVFRKLYIVLLLLLAALLAAGCAGETSSEEPSEPQSEAESAECSEESSGFSEIELPEDSSEPAEESDEPYVYRPYREDGEPTYDGTPLSGTLAVTGVTFLPDSIDGEVGETVFLPWECRPRTAVPGSLTFTVEDPSVASVDETGKVLCLKQGKTKITVNADGKKASCSLHVHAKSASTPLNERIRAVVGDKDPRLFFFGLLDVDGDGAKELIAQCLATGSGVPFAAVYRVESGEMLFSGEVGAVSEKWSVRSGSYADRFVFIAHTQYPSLEGVQVCRDAASYDAESGKWTVVRLSRRSMGSYGNFDYCVNADGKLVSCDYETYRYYVTENAASRFEKDNPVVESAVLVTGSYPAEIEKLLLNPPDP